MGFAAVYIHVPFCLKKCNYCDFLSYPGQPEKAVMKQYFEGLKKEFSLIKKMVSGKIFTPGSDITVYFGGGTPSLAPANLIETMVAMIKEEAVCSGAVLREITLEVNPGTIDEAYLKALKQAGVTRISIGIQSFNDADLRAMGRLHTAKDSMLAVELCRKTGFDNISLDLIYNLPEQTVEKWLLNLKQAVKLRVDHLSCYGLHLSHLSPWGRLQTEGKLTLPEEDTEVAMWQQGRAYLAQEGFLQYEISNFAKQGKQCVHNLKYWRRENYLGLGVGAASCYGRYRWANIDSLEAYLKNLEENYLPIGFQEELANEVVLAEGIFLGLRCTEGILFADIGAKYGVDIKNLYSAQIAMLQQQGLLTVTDAGIKLSAKGQLLANTVFAAFLPE